MSLFTELKRRNVFRVGIAYLVTSWLLIQIADTVFPRIGLPDSSITLVIALLTLGFIPAIIVAWAFELTPEGIQREVDIDRSQSITRSTRHKLDFAIIGILIVALAYFVWESRFSGTDRTQRESGTLSEVINTQDADVPGASDINPTDSRPVTEVVEASARSIAVLPFDTRSGEKSDEYFSAGIHDDLLTQLAKIESIRVISRTSVMQYEETTKPIRQIAAELGVATVLEGGIQRAGDRVRINAQLIEAASDSHLWAETWDKELTATNIFEIQSELASLIAEALQAELAPELRQRIEDQPTESLEAYELTLRGRYLMDKELSEENLDSAATLFREAIRLDPGYAAAWAGLAQALHELVGWHYRPEKEIWPQARQAAEKAVELDPHLMRIRESLLQNIYFGRDFDSVLEEAAAVLELEPGAAGAWYWTSLAHALKGEFNKAVEAMLKASELDPGNPYYGIGVAFVYAMDGRREEALEILGEAENKGYSLVEIGLVYGAMGDMDPAFNYMDRALEDTPAALYYIAANPGADPMREDPRWQQLIARLDAK